VSSDLETLARRAVACKGWRWMPGMLAQWLKDPEPLGRVYRGSDEPEKGFTAPPYGPMIVMLDLLGPIKAKRGRVAEDCIIPDLSDPATLGCLLALVREAWSIPSLYVRLNPYGTDKVQLTWSGPGSTTVLALANAETEAEALVKALEAAE
jgi:hypothetical protein